MRSEPSFSHYLKRSPGIWLDVTVAISITLIVLTVLAHLRLSGQVREFTDQATRAYNEIHDKISINETVLEGFASMLRLAGDSPTIRQYTAEMRRAYPHIYSVGFQQYVPASKKEIFEQQLRDAGHPNFRIKDFSYEEDRQFHDVTPVASYYPTLFADSANPDVEDVLGLDQFAVPFLKEALLPSIKSGQAIATKPFTLAEGGRGYVLYKSLEKIPDFDIDSGKDFDNKAVSILIKTDVLLQFSSDVMPHATVKLSYRDIDNVDTVDTLPATHHNTFHVPFGQIQYQRQLHESGQPFLITLEASNGFSAWDITFGITVVLLALLGSTLYLQGKHRRHTARQEKERALLNLEGERNLLERRVTARTTELQGKTDEIRALAAKIVNLQEDDYRHIARELHDEFGQLITAIGINTKLLANRISDDDPDSNEISDETQVLIDHLHTSIHSLIGRLRPQALDTFGLKASIELCIAMFKLEQSGIECQMKLDPAIDQLPDNYAMTIYRSVQELVNNAIKHGKPTYISLQVMIVDKQARIIVSDNGRGISAVQTQTGYGLAGLNERLLALSGTLQIDSTPMTGVSVSIHIPLQPIATKVSAYEK